MSDFEKRLGEALSAGAEGAPGSTVGLAAGARRRSRARRRTTVAGVAAAVALAVAVPVGIVGLGGSDSDAPVAERVTDPNVGPVADTKATRTETWRNVTLEVPADWEYGDRRAWCADDGDLSTSLVDRPGGLSPDIGCIPAKAHGLTFVYAGVLSGVRPSGEPRPATGQGGIGGWVATASEAGVLVKVAAPRRATVQQVIDSVRALEADEADPNGCPVRSADQRSATGPEQMSICRYAPDGWLEQSEWLSEADTVTAIGTLNTAPSGAPPLLMSSFCPRDPDGPGTVITMNSPDYAAEVVLDKPCTLNTSFRSETDGYRKLTRDVMFWALSPGWSGSLASGVPKPDPLRQLVPPEQDQVADDLQTIEYDGAQADAPVSWVSLDSSGCGFVQAAFGPAGVNPCRNGAGLRFHDEATYDSSTPGRLIEGRNGWRGNEIAGAYAVAVQDPDRALAQQILDSVREVGTE